MLGVRFREAGVIIQRSPLSGGLINTAFYGILNNP